MPGSAPAVRCLWPPAAMAMHFSGRLVQLARSAIDKLVVGVAMTVRGGAMRSSSQRISSFDSSSSGTQSMARSASRTASSMVETKATAGSASGLSSWRIDSRAWCRFAGITSSSSTRKPARAAPSASQRPSGPAPMMATVVTEFWSRPGLLGGQGRGHFLGAGARLQQVLGDPGALLGGQRRDEWPAPGAGSRQRRQCSSSGGWLLRKAACFSSWIGFRSLL